VTDVVKYFNDTPILWAFKTWYIGPSCARVSRFVRRDLCKRAKPAQNAQLGFHTATPSSYPLGRVFIDCMGPLTNTKLGIEVMLLVTDSFSQFVRFFFYEGICDLLET
jgi:hypothetical protein